MIIAVPERIPSPPVRGSGRIPGWLPAVSEIPDEPATRRPAVLPGGLWRQALVPR
jgi:hypothetical protein